MDVYKYAPPSKAVGFIFSALTILPPTMGHSQVLNTTQIMESKLQRFGKFSISGVFQPPNTCALSGGYLAYIHLIGVGGSLPSGIQIGGPETVVAVGAIAQATQTFRNCGGQGTANAGFSVSVTEGLTVTFGTSFSESASGTLSLSGGAPGSGSAAIGISGSKSWATNSSTSQSTSMTVVQNASDSASVPLNTELDISYVVLSKRTRLPVSATGIFDGLTYPCQSAPWRYASGGLSPGERTFTASGEIEFDNVLQGTFTVSPPRAINCSRLSAALNMTRIKHSNWTGSEYKVTSAELRW
jgi:hypothetical protein